MIAAIGLALFVSGALPIATFSEWYTNYWWETPAVIITLLGILLLVASACIKLSQVMP